MKYQKAEWHITILVDGSVEVVPYRFKWDNGSKKFKKKAPSHLNQISFSVKIVSFEFRNGFSCRYAHIFALKIAFSVTSIHMNQAQKYVENFF